MESDITTRKVMGKFEKMHYQNREILIHTRLGEIRPGLSVVIKREEDCSINIKGEEYT